MVVDGGTAGTGRRTWGTETRENLGVEHPRTVAAGKRRCADRRCRMIKTCDRSRVCTGLDGQLAVSSLDNYMVACVGA